METMQDYTNYCTEEQTRRACLLGAPLQEIDFNEDSAVVVTMKPDSRHENYWHKFVDTPTTQQMIGWLREKGLYLEISYDFSGYGMRLYSKSGRVWFCNYQPIYEQAELAAIDAALDYLEKGGTK